MTDCRFWFLLTHLKCRSEPRREVTTHKLNPSHGSCGAGLSIKTSESLSLSDILSDFPVAPPVSNTQREKPFAHSASPLRNVLFLSPWSRGVCSAISVSPRWHGADRREAAPDYRTDVFHLALSVDTSCLRCMRGQHYRAAPRAGAQTPDWNLNSASDVSLWAAASRHSQQHENAERLTSVSSLKTLLTQVCVYQPRPGFSHLQD